MRGQQGIRLTPSGFACVNPACSRRLFKELDGDRTEACVDCDPPREGLPTAFRMLAELDGEGSTAYRPEPGEPFFYVDDRDAPGPDVRPLCSEACCAWRSGPWP